MGAVCSAYEHGTLSQSLNSYSYANDNPITKSDPTGRAFGVDDAAGFLGGGLIGSGLYAVTSLAAQKRVSWSGVAGAFVTGGVIGWGAVLKIFS
jgi:hypothetical protein